MKMETEFDYEQWEYERCSLNKDNECTDCGLCEDDLCGD